MHEIGKVLDSKSSKMNFMTGLILLARSDQEIDADEMCFFKNAANGIGLNDEAISVLEEKMEKGDDLASVKFVNKTQAIFFLREAIQLAYLDEKFDVDERDIVASIAQNNSIADNTLEKIEEWVVSAIEIRKNGDKLLELEA